MKKLSRPMAALVCIASVFGSGCNVYRLFDVPSSDAQTISRARGCFDRGDYTCAAYHYSRASGLSAETAKAENAFMILAQQGAGLSVIAAAAAAMTSASGNSQGGKFITYLAKQFARNGSETKRLAIYSAYALSYDAAVTTPALQALIRFVAGAALAAEILGETASASGAFPQSDWVLDPTTCSGANAACGAPANNILAAGAAYGASPPLLDGTSEAFFAGTASLHMLNAALYSMVTALGTLGSSPVSGISSSFSDAAAAIVDADSPLYREGLLIKGIGD